MRKLFRDYQDAMLVICALGLVGIVLGCYVWGVRVMILEANRGLQVGSNSSQAIEIDLDGARAVVDLRGAAVESVTPAPPSEP